MDLHTHSTFSDGVKNPLQLLNAAETYKVEIFSITDHDTIEGTVESLKYIKNYNFCFITGVELSVNYNGKKMELLGYNFDPNHKKFQKITTFLQDKRVSRIKQIASKLDELNLKLGSNELENLIRENKCPGRPHIARLLVKAGYVQNVSEAFQRYLAKNRPAYVKRETIEMKRAIELIKSAKGTAILPHPLIFENENIEKLSNNIQKFISWGLDGLELYYSYDKIVPPIEKTKIETGLKKLRKLSKEMKLLVTGGSDYHEGENKLGVEISENEFSQLLARFKLED